MQPKLSDDDRLDVLLVDNDDKLISDMSALHLTQMRVSFASTTDLSASAINASDVIFVSLDLVGAFDLIERISRHKSGTISIALVSPQPGRVSLEFSMLRAELRGAVLAIPKPVDAIEIAYLAARELRRATNPGGGAPSELETIISQHMVA